MTRTSKPVRDAAWLCLLALNLPQNIQAAEAPAASASSAVAPVEFDPAFIDHNGPNAGVDLSQFANGNRVLPGSYAVDLYLNNEFLLSDSVQFEDGTPGFDAHACLTQEHAKQFGLKPEYATALANSGHDACIDLTSVMPEAQLRFDINQQRLDVSIPQAYLDPKVRGAVSPKRWDAGINSAQVNYNLNVSHQSGSGKSDQLYGGINSGLNLAGWRVRNQSNLAQDPQGHNRLQSLQSWIGHDVDALHSQLRIGDSNSGGLFADSIPFRGVQLWYDKDMDPDSLQGFAPVLRGVAKSNAKITVSQNGRIIDTRYVAPGPFEISDLSQSSGNGDLTVTVTEADGSQHSFVQPYASLPMMLRAGSWDYNFSSGQLRDSSITQHPNFARLSVARGLDDGTTVYGGVTASSGYRSALLGASRVLGPIGALALDATVAQSDVPAGNDEQTRQGQALRLQYSKNLPSSGTQIQLSATRYSNTDYLTLADATRLRGGDDSGFDTYWVKHKEQLTLNQDLGRWGSISLSATRNSYWYLRDSDLLANLNYNVQVGRASVGLYYYTSINAHSSTQRSYGINVSMPLDPAVPNANATLMANQDTTQVGVSGTALEDGKLSYSVAAANGDSGSGSAQLSYNGAYAQLNASVFNSGSNTQTTAGISGSAVAHSGGVTLGQPLYGAAVLLHAPGAAGMKIEGQPGAQIDGQGYALVSSARPYHNNRIALDLNNVPNNVDVQQAVVNVVPRHNAVVQADFKVAHGDKIVAHISRSDNQPIPFGSRVLDQQQRQVSLVGDDGMAYLTGLKNGQQLRVQWGAKAEQGCAMVYAAPAAMSPDAPFMNVDLVCQQ